MGLGLEFAALGFLAAVRLFAACAAAVIVATAPVAARAVFHAEDSGLLVGGRSEPVGSGGGEGLVPRWDGLLSMWEGLLCAGEQCSRRCAALGGRWAGLECAGLSLGGRWAGLTCRERFGLGVRVFSGTGRDTRDRWAGLGGALDLSWLGFDSGLLGAWLLGAWFLGVWLAGPPLLSGRWPGLSTTGNFDWRS